MLQDVQQSGAELLPPEGLSDDLSAFASADGFPVPAHHPVDLLNSYAPIFVIAFLVTLLATPIVRRLAIRHGIVDHPDESRKQHRLPIAYLGGVAVFLGVLVAIGASYMLNDAVTAVYPSVPIAVVIGMIAIAFTGFADDLWGWDPWTKVAGQLVAAAGLAISNVGVHVAEGLLRPILGPGEEVLLAFGSIQMLNSDVFYWTGTVLIALFVLGGCNAANLIDGLDGLLSGVIGIVAVGLLAISLLMAAGLGQAASIEDATSMAGARIVLSVALLGAVLGFLPHNFNPATIFLGDCGSLLLGYLSVVIILMLGDQGQTHLVIAGLIIFAVPIMDTILAIIRRKLAGTSMSAADDQHLHHQLKRTLGGVKRAVFALYGIGLMFAALGVSLAALVMYTELRIRAIYAITLVLFSFVGAIAFKAARQQQYEKESARVKRPRKKGVAQPRPKSPARSESTSPSSEAGSAAPPPAPHAARG